MPPYRPGLVTTTMPDVAGPAEPAEPSMQGDDRRAPWWYEVVLIAGSYLIYSWVADRAPRDAAVAHGRSILSTEKAEHLNIEHWLNHLWTTHGRGLMVFGNLYYDLMHFIVPLGALLWVYFFRQQVYRRVRTPVLVVSLIALAMFWLWPTAPPRLIPELGLYDTIANVHTLGGGGAHGITASENPFASLPSLHVAWATWAAYAVWTATRGVVLRTVVAVNLVVMSFLVVATGNHWVWDVLAGIGGVPVSVVLSYGAVSIWRAQQRQRVSARQRVAASIDDARR
jgi:hypothetical protein